MSEIKSAVLAKPSVESSLSIRGRWCGRVAYADGLALQEQARAEVKTSSIGQILGLEHTPVITLGKRGRAGDDLRVTAEEAKARGLDVVPIDRGGQATLHSPGQLVIYPILPLRDWGWGVRTYVKLLETATDHWLEASGIASRPCGCEPSLYTERGKIAFFGIRVSEGISSHGLAINVTNDLDLFALIRSCGVEKERFDSMASHGPTEPLNLLFEQWIPYFLRLAESFDLTK